MTKLRGEDHTLKSLVFSQFTSMLDLVHRRLQIAGFKCARLQGSMSPTARDATIKYFMNNHDVTVFLISLKAGGVALNLVEASRVFILGAFLFPFDLSRAHAVDDRSLVESRSPSTSPLNLFRTLPRASGIVF